MKAPNTSTWRNDTSVLHNVSSAIFDFTENNSTKNMDTGDVVLLSLCALGLPGNLLVITVYARMMTSSMRVYMFALAVADSLVCVSGLVLLAASMDFKIVVVVVAAINTTITFSIFLLVFVSIERVLAVTRPHKFNMKAKRAKKHLSVIAVVSLTYATLLTLANIYSYNKLAKLIEAITMSACVFTMIVCYIILVATLFKRHKGSTLYTKDQYRSGPSESSIVTTSSNFEDTSVGENNVSTETSGPPTISMALDAISNENNDSSRSTGPMPTAPKAATKRTVDSLANVHKNVMLLIIVTVVFTACWIPSWMSGIGIYIHKDTRRVFIINSVINPFIYGVASAMFREDVRQFYRKILVKMSCCCCRH